MSHFEVQRPSARDELFALPLVLIVALTLYRGGNVDSAMIAYAALSVSCLAAAALIAWRSSNRTNDASKMGFDVTWLVWVGFGALAAHAVLSLIPLPAGQWAKLPGRGELKVLADSLGLQTLPATLDAVGTSRSLLVIISAAGAFALARVLPERALSLVLASLMTLVVLEALIGLLQVALATPSWLGFESAIGGRRASGTFVNKNHFATLLAMTLPLFVLRITSSFHFADPDSRPERSLLLEMLWLVAAIVVGTALLASLSRAGIFAAGAALLVCCLGYALMSKSSGGRGAVAAVLFLTIALAATTNLSALVDSVSGDPFAASVDSRSAMTSTTFAAAGEFSPFGSGLGTFAMAYQRFQPTSLSGFIEYAHNDYAQLVFEAGWTGIAVICLALATLSTLLVRTLAGRRQRAEGVWMRLAGLSALIAIAVHAWFDFPLHIPSLAVIASVFAGIACRPLPRRNSVAPYASRWRNSRSGNAGPTIDASNAPE